MTHGRDRRAPFEAVRRPKPVEGAVGRHVEAQVAADGGAEVPEQGKHWVLPSVRVTERGTARRGRDWLWTEWWIAGTNADLWTYAIEVPRRSTLL